jgi:DNA-binding winged helix-turn-helix (wHTH) protein/predicted ATPase
LLKYFRQRLVLNYGYLFVHIHLPALSEEPSAMIYRLGNADFELDSRLYELRRNGSACRIEPQVFDVLFYLVQHHDRVVSKQELFEQIWPERIVSDATLSSRLKAARQALGDDGRRQRYIRTLHGRGFRFVAAVSIHNDTGAATLQTAADTSSIPTVSADRGPDTDTNTDNLSAAAVLPGRLTEFGHCQRWLAKALNGIRQMVFLTGEAGLGKTTLIDAFTGYARRHDKTILITYGQCLEQHGAGEPYLPVLEALARLARESADGALTELLAQRAPTWLAQLPWLISAGEQQQLQQRIGNTTRERMLREIVEVLESLSTRQPVLLILEDLHWCDYSTLDLLERLARRREPARLMLIGSYRPADVKVQQHPLHALQQELRIRGQCVELALTYLDREAVHAYLTQRCAGAHLPAGLSALLHQRSDGNPLFMITIIDDWIAQGALLQTYDGWVLTLPPEDLAQQIPADLQVLIEHQVQRLAVADQVLLEAAAVAGESVSTTVVAAALDADLEHIEGRFNELARQGQFLQLKDSDTPTGSHDSAATFYRFTHALYQDVLYQRIPAARRRRLHHCTGLQLETGYGAQACEHAVELAMHFVHGGDDAREPALTYLQKAAEYALARSAYHEAVRHLRQALQVLQWLPDSAERQRRELRLLIELAPALITTCGWSDSDAEDAYSRARSLCAQLGDNTQLAKVLYRLATLYEYRAEYAASQELIVQRMQLPDSGDDIDLQLESHELLACSTFHQGELAQALHHVGHGIQLYQPQRHAALISPHGKNLGVACYLWAALTLWLHGFPQRALQRLQLGLDMARSLDHAYSLVSALNQAGFLYQFRREPALAEQMVRAALAIAQEQGFPYRIATNQIVLGWALAEQGQSDAGLSWLRQGIAGYRATGARMDLPYFLAFLAETYARAGDTEPALAALDEALTMVSSSRAFFYQAELHRLTAAMLLQQHPQDMPKPSCCVPWKWPVPSRRVRWNCVPP